MFPKPLHLSNKKQAEKNSEKEFGWLGQDSLVELCLGNAEQGIP